MTAACSYNTYHSSITLTNQHKWRNCWVAVGNSNSRANINEDDYIYFSHHLNMLTFSLSVRQPISTRANLVRLPPSARNEMALTFAAVLLHLSVSRSRRCIQWRPDCRDSMQPPHHHQPSRLYLISRLIPWLLRPIESFIQSFFYMASSHFSSYWGIV